MSFDQLKTYVTTQRLAGVSDEHIITALREKHWHEDLITKAIATGNETPEPWGSELKLDTRLLSVFELIASAWNAFTAQLRNYILTTLIAMIIPLGVISIFILPIIYDVLVLHFTAADFISKAMLPIVVIHSVLGALALILVMLWGTLALYTTVVHDGTLSPKLAFKRAWERLPGFTFVGILTTLITLIGFATLIIPGIIFAVYLSFASFAYVAHGARGKAALFSSLALVHGRWWRTLWMIIAPVVLAIIPLAILGAILPGAGEFLGRIILTPLTMIYMFMLYQNLTAYDKSHPKEEQVDKDELKKEIASAE